MAEIGTKLNSFYKILLNVFYYTKKLAVNHKHEFHTEISHSFLIQFSLLQLV